MKYNNMATDNKGIMVYLTPDLVDAIGQYCLDNGITRKIGGDEAAPSLGTGIAHYLKSTILNTVPLPHKNLVSTQESNNNIGLSEEKVTDLIQQYNNNIGLNEERVLDLIKEYNNNNGLSEERVADLIEEKIATSPPTLSLLDVEREARRECGRLIGSAIESVTTKNNAELAAMNTAWVEAKNEWWLSLEQVKIEHRLAITEIARLSKLIENLSPAASLEPIPDPLKNSDPLRWNEFCELIGEPLLPEDKRNKASGDEMVALAKSKGFNGWKYNGNKRKFTH
jgi:hypothetical protein